MERRALRASRSYTLGVLLGGGFCTYCMGHKDEQEGCNHPPLPSFCIAFRRGRRREAAMAAMRLMA